MKHNILFALQNYQQQRRRRILALASCYPQLEKPLIPEARFNFNTLDNISCHMMFRYIIFKNLIKHLVNNI